MQAIRQGSSGTSDGPARGPGLFAREFAHDRFERIVLEFAALPLLVAAVVNGLLLLRAISLLAGSF